MTSAPDPDDLLKAHKWVRIMCDYSAEGVWDIKGRSCPADDLPVSDEIRAMLREWQEWYDVGDSPATMPFRDNEARAAYGLFIAQEVKSALPDWTVIYFDESKLPENWQPGEPRDAFEYEITAEILHSGDDTALL